MTQNTPNRNGNTTPTTKENNMNIVTITESATTTTSTSISISSKPTKRTTMKSSKKPGQFELYGERIGGTTTLLVNDEQLAKLNALVARIDDCDGERDEDGLTDGTYAYFELKETMSKLYN